MRFLFILALAILCAGCQKKVRPIDEDRQALRLNIHTEPPTLDARKSTDTSSMGVISMCFEGLMKRGRDRSVHPALAYHVEISEDNTVYTFHLRPAKWWDGKPVTAYDFEKTWKTILSPSFPSGFACDLYVLKNGKAAKNDQIALEEVGVKALDAKTLRVELEYPIPYFLDLAASHSFLAVPSHITALHPNWADNSGPYFVGNGPYKLKKWKHHNCIELVKNELYWDQDVVTLDEIDFCIIEDPNTELNMFESGELDWAGYPLSMLPTDALEPLSKARQLITYPLSGVYYYIFNTNVPPFNNLNIRKAFSYAINRKAIIDNITLAYQAPATSFIPPTIWDLQSHFEDNNVQEAQRLLGLGLEEMGWTLETMPKITLIYNSSEGHHKIAQAIQEQWFQAFGFRVKLANVDWKVFLNELKHKQFQIARMGGVAGYSDPTSFFDLYKYPESSNNFSGWGHPEFTRLIEAAERCPDLNEREALMRKAEAIFISEMPVAPIYYYQGTYVKKGYLRGVELTEFSEVDFKFAFLEQQ
ncbi:MAG: peptide ABC transporter substrate-binding protein [Simkaniaceae bacterium]|nr:peptide ABC transporter substrate-binding protein [Candidatus Sacchlamyda saccharinae]